MPETKKKTFDVADIRHHGTKLILPKGMTLEEGINLLYRRQEFDEADVTIHRDYDVFPYDGAVALEHVLTETFGFVAGTWTPPKGWNPPEPPTMITVRTGVNETKNVPWRSMELPGGLGVLDANSRYHDGRFRFRLTGKTKNKNRKMYDVLFDEVQKRLATHSIYNGKALAVRFFDNDKEPLPMPEPMFMDTDVDVDSLIFPEHVRMAVETSLFTPLRRLDDLVANNVPVKRGILLGGPYGTGKTMSAKVASKLAVDNGITFIYVQSADELAHTIQFAKPYAARAVCVFCEDIDAVMPDERDQKVNEVLNTIDGVDTKSMNLITLLTTNHIEQITQAMLRPGRLDAVIEVDRPDAEAVKKLLRVYGGRVIPDNANLTELGEELAGAIPAVIAEVVKRAKLHQLYLQEPGTKIEELSVEALMNSAKTLRDQRKLLAEREEEQKEVSAT